MLAQYQYTGAFIEHVSLVTMTGRDAYRIVAVDAIAFYAVSTIKITHIVSGPTSASVSGFEVVRGHLD